LEERYGKTLSKSVTTEEQRSPINSLSHRTQLHIILA
jgi:hypothetical protein